MRAAIGRQLQRLQDHRAAQSGATGAAVDDDILDAGDERPEAAAARQALEEEGDAAGERTASAPLANDEHKVHAARLPEAASGEKCARACRRAKRRSTS